ncbi:MAG: hypothetical protein UHP25_02705 [Prevotella sp.]|nr:hypothetical protein [Prevotella sp.]
MKEDYRAGDMVYILLEPQDVAGIVSDWFERRWPVSLNLRRSKDDDRQIVVSTDDTHWASHILKWHNYLEVVTRKKQRSNN